MFKCVIAQPIHQIATEKLQQAGIDVCQSPDRDEASLQKVIHDADAVIIRDGLSAKVMASAPHLKVIANHGTGFDKIDVNYAKQQGILVTYTPETNVRAVAEHAFMLMLAAAHQAIAADQATRTGNWRYKYDLPMQSLHGKTLGIVGWGHTGKLLTKMVSALAMPVLVWSPSASREAIEAYGAKAADSFEMLLHHADVVSLHRPLRPDTKHTMNADTLGHMKPTAILVNTARGGLIDEVALVAALQRKQIFGAGLDVFEEEPLPQNAAIAQLNNVVLSPHVAGSSVEALYATASQCAEQVISVLSGQQPIDIIPPMKNTVVQ